MKNKPLISVIIPAYNAEKTIAKCLDSILSQSYVNIEIILINDGSSDNTLQLAETYAKIDQRVKIFTQVNQGVSKARNFGLEKASGLYMCCLDSDDIVKNDYVLHLFEGIDISNGKGLVLQNLNYSSGNQNDFTKEFEDRLIWSDQYYKLFSTYKIELYGFNCGKLFNLNIIKENNIKYHYDISVSEDLLFMLEYILHTEYVHFIPGSDYYYNESPYDLYTYKFASFNSELMLFEKYNGLLHDFKDKYKINDEDLLHAYKSGADMLLRIFYAHYRINNKLVSKKKRYGDIRKILNIWGPFFKKYYMPDSLKERFSRFLLNHNCILFFDNYRMLIRYSQEKRVKNQNIC